MDPEDIEDFLEKATRVQDAVKKIASGEADKDLRTQKEIQNLKRELEIKEQEKKEKESAEYKEKIKRQGRPGKGQYDNYRFFCERCFLEFDCVIDKCSKCNGELITREERKATIASKVNVLRKEREHHKRAKARYLQHTAQVKQGKVFNNAGGTDYQAWDFWEPDTDSDEEPILPNTPEFKAMEKDMLERSAKREQDMRTSNAFKMNGNKLFKKRDYKGAIAEYTKALEARKDHKAVYTNRALVYLKMKKYTKAIKDCTTVLEIWEFLEEKKSKDDIVVKALVRRAQGYRAKKQYQNAVNDLREALSLKPSVPFNSKLLADCERDLRDFNMGEEAMREAMSSRGRSGGGGGGEAHKSNVDDNIDDEKNQRERDDQKHPSEQRKDGAEDIRSGNSNSVENGEVHEGKEDENGFLILEPATSPQISSPQSSMKNTGLADSSNILGEIQAIVIEVLQQSSRSSPQKGPSASDDKRAAAAAETDDSKQTMAATLKTRLDKLLKILESNGEKEKVLFRKSKGFKAMAWTVFGKETCEEKGERNEEEGGEKMILGPEAEGQNGQIEAKKIALDIIVAACEDVDHNRRHVAHSKRVLPHLLPALKKATTVNWSGEMLTSGYELLASLGTDSESRAAVCDTYAKDCVDAIVHGLNYRGGEEQYRVQAGAATALCNLSHDTKTGLKGYISQLQKSSSSSSCTPLDALVSLLDKQLFFGASNSGSVGSNAELLHARDCALSALANLLGVSSIRKAYVSDRKRLKVLSNLVCGGAEAANVLLLQNAASPSSLSSLLLLPPEVLGTISRALGVLLNCAVEPNAHQTVFAPRTIDGLLLLLRTTTKAVARGGGGGGGGGGGESNSSLLSSSLQTCQTIVTRTLLMVRRACKYLHARKQLNRDIIAKGVVHNVLECLSSFLTHRYNATAVAAAERDASKEHISAILARCAHDEEGRTDIATYESSSSSSSSSNTTTTTTAAVEKVKGGISGVEWVVRLLTDSKDKERGVFSKNDDALIANTSTLISVMSIDKSTWPVFGKCIPVLIQALRRDDNVRSNEFQVMQKNAAVALAKIAKYPANIKKIRDLQGMELLYRAVAKGSAPEQQ
eukprot:jgi/Bigna1/84051/fgenesh1_pg.121_\